MLPLRPRPKPEEGFASWVRRVAEANGFALEDFVRIVRKWYEPVLLENGYFGFRSPLHKISPDTIETEPFAVLMTAATGVSTDRFQYGYDQNGNVLDKNNLVNSAFSELYHPNSTTSGDNNNGGRCRLASRELLPGMPRRRVLPPPFVASRLSVYLPRPRTGVDGPLPQLPGGPLLLR